MNAQPPTWLILFGIGLMAAPALGIVAFALIHDRWTSRQKKQEPPPRQLKGGVIHIIPPLPKPQAIDQIVYPEPRRPQH